MDNATDDAKTYGHRRGEDGDGTKQRQKKTRPTFRVKVELSAFANFSLALTFIDSHFIKSNFMNFILKKNPNFELSQLFNFNHAKIQLC